MENKIDRLSFQEFQVFLSDIFDVDMENIKPEAFFITDLGVDSLKLAEMFLRFQSLGMDFSPDLAWRFQTVGEAYQYYLNQIGQ